MNPTLWWALASGALLAGGLVLAVGGLRRAEPSLAEAFRALDDDAGPIPGPRVGLPLLPGQERLLQLRGRSVGEHATQKLVGAAIGLLLPALMATCGLLLIGYAPVVPVIVGLVGAVVGFFVPDVALLRAGRAVTSDAGEALFTYFDLVTLERLANMSASQALASAASLSEIPLFVRIREALDRARLEQRPPWGDLKRLATELRLPELGDLADVMRLDETGAALSGVLRARVRELRDAHLTRARIDAHAASEAMTLWMVLPAMIFGLIFLVPPLLRLLT